MMKVLPPPETVRPRLDPYGRAVIHAYETFHQTPSGEAFTALTDALLRSLAERPETEPLPPEAHLQSDLGLDSIGLAEAAFLIEDLFAHRLDNAQLQAIATVGDLRTCLEREVWQGTLKA